MAINGVYLKIGKMAKQARIKNNLTQFEIAEKLGYDSPQFISLVERGISKIPLESLGRLVVVLDLPEKKILEMLVAEYKNSVVREMEQGKKKIYQVSKRSAG